MVNLVAQTLLASGLLAKAHAGCCSWDGGHSCGGTTDYCKASQANCEQHCQGKWIGGGPTPPGPGGSTAGGSHFWDCSGMSCDAGTLQPWDPSEYKASAAYAPMDPNEHGGSKYGEKMWLTGAASDAMSSQLGGDDGCCGHHAEGGCGKCVLIQNMDAVHSDWTAVVMKKSQCPSYSHGCDVPHLDLAIPGYDNLQYSTANTCGAPHTTLSRSQSAACGDWYNHGSSTIQGCSCSSLPDGPMKKGCELFTSWGWTRGDPTFTWHPVECPAAFKNAISGAFGPSGPQAMSNLTIVV